MNNEKLLEKLQMKEMVATQINSWELVLKKKELKDVTINRKINNIIGFYTHLAKIKANKEKVRVENITDIAFEYVRDGYFSEDNIDNEGSYGYRRNIYYNIREGFNYIYEGLFKGESEVIKDLSDEQKEILDDISKNKWFKVVSIKDDKYSIQTQLIEELGLKVYFDEEGKAYVYSHETAELIGKRNVEVMDKCDEIIERFSEIANVENSTHVKNIDISTVKDTYIVNTNNGGSKENTTYKMSKDLTIHYILGLNGKKYSDFKFKYQSAFNYIEQEHNKLLQEYAELKDSFLKMYNDVRKRNRDLLIVDHNKKTKRKKAS